MPPAAALSPPSVTVFPAPVRAVGHISGAAFEITMEARRWFALAVGSLVIAGLLSLAVVFGRLPGFGWMNNDPLFFKRCLVVHVDLALVVWFYAFLSGLAAVRCGRTTGAIGIGAFILSVAGVGGMLAGALMRGAQPILANYVPVIDHPLFLGGLVAFFVGTLVFLLETLGTSAPPRRGGPPADSAIGLQTAALAVVLAAATWLATRAGIPAGLDPWTRYEFSAWGAGHVLQVANVAAMLGVWLWLLSRATGRVVLSAKLARGLFTLLLAPHFAMPLLTARGSMDTLYHSGATQLMRWGIFPVVLIVLGFSLRHLWKHALASADPLARAARVGFFASAGLTVFGFILGACIRSSTTLVPAHYHASLGAVTVAFMTAAFLVCAAARRTPEAPHLVSLARSARRQLVLFGCGQTVFALGFAIGGVYGLGRKAYAGEQHVRTAGEYAGLGVMGLGGLVATVAGVWFLILISREIRGWWGRRPALAVLPRPIP